MNKLLGTALIAALSLTAHSAFAGEMTSEKRSVDAQVTKVRLGGIVELRLTQGTTPSLTISGDSDEVRLVTTRQSGDTLQIDTESRGFHNFRSGSHKLRAELTVPNLTELVSQGVGSSQVSGFSGESIRIALDGAGAMTLSARYRNVDASLGGVGGLTLDVGQPERVDLRMSGAGRVTAKGQARTLRAHLSGVGSLDAQELRADAVDVDLSGMGSASVFAKTSANLNLSGLGSANVYGNPAKRSSSASGLGKVHWQ
jgi:hypothetical protein